MKNKLAKNSLAIGLATMIVTAGLSFSANGAPTTRYVAHSEARFLAGTSGIADLTDAISRAIEGESADCSTDAISADDCNAVEENSDVALPIGDAASLTLGAVDNYAGANSNGTSRASSGVIGDNGFIDTDYDGPDGAVTLGLSNGSLTGPIGDALADVTARIGAVSGQADADKDAVTRDYNIASATVEADLPILDTINTALEENLEGFDFLGTLDGTDEITLSELSELFPEQLAPLLDGLGELTSLVADATVTFPSVNDLTSSLANYSENGVTINAQTGRVTANLETLLATIDDSSGNPLDLNNLPPNTDLLQYVLPAVATGLDEIVDGLFATVIDEIVSKSSVTVSLLSGLVPPVTLEASTLGALLDPLRAGLVSGLDTLGEEVLEPVLSALVADDALAGVAQIVVNNPDLYGQDLVADDATASGEGPAASITALRLVLGGGQLADVRLGNAVVVPDDNAVVADDADTDSTDADEDADADTDSTDADAASDADADADSGAAADADADANADAVADADAQSDADVTQALPAAGAGRNLLPFMLLGLALALFGGGVLLNEKRRVLQS